MVRERLAALALVGAVALRAGAEPALPETQLPLRLLGTVVAGHEERSVAVIENGGATAVVRTGDPIAGARVQEIRKDGVVLAQAGRLERLAFAPIATPSSGASNASAGSVSRVDRDDGEGDTAERRARQDARAARRAEVAVRTRTRRAPAVPASADPADEEVEAGAPPAASLSNEQLLVQLAKQARYAPLLGEGGKLHGVALMDIRPDSTLERLGLRNGDVVVSIAGVKVDNTSKAFDALRALDPRAGGEVLIERRGLPTRISIPPGAL